MPLSDRDAYLPRQRKPGKNATPRVVGGRNQLMERVVETRIEGLMAKVVFSLGRQRVTSIVTADAVADLDRKNGDVAMALIKSTAVMIAKP